MNTIDTDKPKKSKKPQKKKVQIPQSKQKNLHGAVQIIEIKAGRRLNKTRRKRYKHGPKKGEIMTSTDEDEDEENLNTQNWSESSADDNDPRLDRKAMRPLLATGPSVPNTGQPIEEEKDTNADPIVLEEE